MNLACNAGPTKPAHTPHKSDIRTRKQSSTRVLQLSLSFAIFVHTCSMRQPNLLYLARSPVTGESHWTGDDSSWRGRASPAEPPCGPDPSPCGRWAACRPRPEHCALLVYRRCWRHWACPAQTGSNATAWLLACLHRYLCRGKHHKFLQAVNITWCLQLNIYITDTSDRKQHNCMASCMPP